MITINGNNTNYLKVKQGTRINLVSDATTVRWTIYYAPVSVNNESYAASFLSTGTTTSTSLSEYLDTKVHGTFKLGVIEDSGTETFAYIESEAADEKVLLPFPSESTEVSPTFGWARKVERSVATLAQNKGNITVTARSNTTHVLGDIVSLIEVSDKDFSGILYNITNPANVVHTTGRRLLGVVVDKYTNNVSGSNYVVFIQGSIVVDNSITFSADADSNIYLNTSSMTITSSSVDSYIGKFFNSSKVLTIINPMTIPMASSSSSSGGGSALVYYIDSTNLSETVDSVFTLGTAILGTTISEISMYVTEAFSNDLRIKIGEVGNDDSMLTARDIEATEIDFKSKFDIDYTLSATGDIILTIGAVTDNTDGYMIVTTYYSGEATSPVPPVSENKVKSDLLDPTQGYLDAKVQDSIVVDTSTHKMKLSGDSAAPGNSYYYGTNGSGTKGYHAGIFTDKYVALDSTESSDYLANLISGSVTVSGTPGSMSLSLDNDSAAPGNGYYYGTNIAGAKGFYPFPAAYGEMYEINSSGTNAITITSNGVYYGWESASEGECLNSTFVGGTPDKINISADGAGDYKVTVTGTIKLSDVDTVFNVAVYADGSKIVKSERFLRVTDKDDYCSFSISCVYPNAVLDTDFDLRFTSTLDGSSINIYAINFLVERIGF